MTTGAIVLCGGKSTRMGTSKAALPFGPESMLQRVVRLLGTVVSPIVVVAARDQVLPGLPEKIIVARDEVGVLEGIAKPGNCLLYFVDADAASVVEEEPFTWSFQKTYCTRRFPPRPYMLSQPADAIPPIAHKPPKTRSRRCSTPCWQRNVR